METEVNKEWLEGYDPIASGEQDEAGIDLASLRANLTLSPSDRYERYEKGAKNVLKLIHAARDSGFAEAGRGLGL
ncbi:hypothetical protein BH11ARM2_BH11ARM2_26020 [soil metagenome]